MIHTQGDRADHHDTINWLRVRALLFVAKKWNSASIVLVLAYYLVGAYTARMGGEIPLAGMTKGSSAEMLQWSFFIGPVYCLFAYIISMTIRALAIGTVERLMPPHDREAFRSAISFHGSATRLTSIARQSKRTRKKTTA